MAVPKRKVSISKKKIKHNTWQTNIIKKLINKTNLTKCSNCHKTKLKHRVCKNCWFYWWKQVLTIKSKSKEQIIEE